MSLKKGASVFRVKTYDDRGTFSIERCTVHAAGAKYIHLERANGSMRKHREYTNLVGQHVYSTFLVPATCLSDTEIELRALALADTFIVEMISFRQMIIRREIDENRTVYSVPGIRNYISEMHEPRVVWVRP